MKTKEELNTLKEESETLNNKFKELAGEDLKSVLGGSVVGNNKQLSCPVCKEPIGTTLEVIVRTKSLICPNCGLHLYIE